MAFKIDEKIWWCAIMQRNYKQAVFYKSQSHEYSSPTAIKEEEEEEEKLIMHMSIIKKNKQQQKKHMMWEQKY